MAMYYKAQSHNWQLKLKQTGMQLFDWSTTVRKVVVIAENTMSKSKQWSKWPSPALTHPARQRRHWRTEAARRRDPALSTQFVCGVWGRRVQSCMFCTPCLAVFPTHFSQLDLNPANFEATLETEWILAFVFLREPQLRHHYVVSWKYWWDVLQFFSHTDCQDDSCQKNYEKLSKFVSVTANILSVLFLRDMVYSYNGRLIESRIVYRMALFSITLDEPHQISRTRHYSTFNICNIATAVLYVITKN